MISESRSSALIRSRQLISGRLATRSIPAFFMASSIAVALVLVSSVIGKAGQSTRSFQDPAQSSYRRNFPAPLLSQRELSLSKNRGSSELRSASDVARAADIEAHRLDKFLPVRRHLGFWYIAVLFLSSRPYRF